MSHSAVRVPPALLQAVDRLPAQAFTAQEAFACGVSPGQLQRLVRHGLLVRTRRGIYHRGHSESSAPDALRRTAIATHLGQLEGTAVAAHVTAAFLHGLRTPWSAQQDDLRLYILRTPDIAHVRLDPYTVVWPAQFDAEHVCLTDDGIAVTTVARTALDVARGCPFERALVIVDHALRCGVSRDELRSLMQYMKGWPGTRVLRPAVEHADGRSESGLESQARGILLASGLPAPDLQVPMVVASGQLYRPDMVWVEQEVIVEIDGRGKLDSRQSLVAEKTREDDLRDLGFRVVRLTYDDLVDPRRLRLRRLAERLDVELKPYNPTWGQSQLLDPGEAQARRRRRQRDNGRF